MKKTVNPLFLIIVTALTVIAIVIISLLPRKKTKVEILVDQQQMLLKQQQMEIDKLKQEQQKNVDADLKRDSILKSVMERNDSVRQTKIYYINQNKNEKINRINSNDFTRDSIRRAFAN